MKIYFWGFSTVITENPNLDNNNAKHNIVKLKINVEINNATIKFLTILLSYIWGMGVDATWIMFLKKFLLSIMTQIEVQEYYNF